MTTFHVDCTSARRRMALRARHFRDVGIRPLEAAAADAANVAASTTAWKDQTGKTRASIKVRGRSLHERAIVARGAAVFLEDGTGRYGMRGRDYVITAKNSKFLHFRVNGRWVHTTHVVHPGIKPTHFMRDAAEQVRPRFVAACVRSAHQAIAGR